MIDRRASSLRHALSSHEPGRGKRYPQALRDRVAEYARARRASGVSWATIAAELGLSFKTVHRWCTPRSDAPRAMRAVHVVPDGDHGIALVSPSGIRVEGVTVADVIAVLRAFG